MNLKQLQEQNCKGCFYANPDKVGTEKACCTYPGVPHIVDGKCLTRKQTTRIPRIVGRLK